MCRQRRYASNKARVRLGGGRRDRDPPRSSLYLSGELEYVRLERDTGVELHDLGQRVTGVDPEDRVGHPKHGIVQIEEAVAIAYGLELLLPHGELKFAELGPVDVPLGDHAHECVEPVDAPVDGLEAGGERCAPRRDDDVFLGLLAVGSNDVPIGIPKLDEVEDVRV